MKQNAMKKLTACLLLTGLLLSTAACGNSASDGGTAKESAASGETAATSEETAAETKLTPDLPDSDFEGADFTVLGREYTDYPQFSNFEIYAESETGDVVNDAVYRRNRDIEEKYNVKIGQVLDNKPQELLNKSVTSGDDLYDLAYIELMYVGTVATNGCFYDMTGTEYIDFTKPWWNPEVNDSLSVGGRLFFTTSDFSLRDKNRVYITAYNMEMIDNFGLGDPVAVVRDGKWTIELMNTYVKAVAADLDGDGTMTDADRYGLTMDSYNAFQTFLTGCDNSIVTKDGDDGITLTVDNEHMISSIDKVIALTCDTNTALFCNDFNGKVSYDFWGVSSRVFYAGNALFTVAFPHALQKYSANCDFEYGVLPAPKYDEAQEKYCAFPDVVGSMVFGIPITVPDTSFTGFMLEALSAASTDTTLSAYYEVSCKTKYTYNADSAEMLDLIFSNIVYDLGTIYSFGNINTMFTEDIPKAKVNNFASLYAKKESKALADIEKTSLSLAEVG